MKDDIFSFYLLIFRQVFHINFLNLFYPKS